MILALDPHHPVRQGLHGASLAAPGLEEVDISLLGRWHQGVDLLTRDRTTTALSSLGDEFSIRARRL